MIQPIALSATYKPCCKMQDSMAVMTELLAFENGAPLFLVALLI